MKLTFTYTDTPDLSSLSRDDIFSTHFEIPDEALHLIGVKERVLAIAELVSKFTEACLHVSCKELDLKNHPVKMTTERHLSRQLRHETRSFVMQFVHLAYPSQKRQMRILMPVLNVVPQTYLIARKHKRKKTLPGNLISLRYSCETDEQRRYSQHLNDLTQQLLILLGAQPGSDWRSQGFHPYWVDSALITRWENRSKRQQAEQRKHQKEEERRRAREAKLAEKAAKLTEQGILPAEPPKTGAGRRVGAVPGIFKGIQFRSQLEIRFATELEARGITWIYEGERLGDGSYLVDFYLPDYGAWVEVKGKFEARDDYLLKDVAAYLKQERGHRLFVYTSGKPRLVNPSGYRILERQDFWNILLK